MKKLFLLLFVSLIIFPISGFTKTIPVQNKEPKSPMEFKSNFEYQAKIKTEKGEINCLLYHKDAPLSVTNFIQLAKNDFYNGLTFHRVIPGFVAQGGDPMGTGAGGPGYTVKAEIKKKHTKGALAWARLPDRVNPEQRSSGSQFYIALEALPNLDGAYTVFGQVTSGMDTVLKIQKGDKILGVEIFEVMMKK